MLSDIENLHIMLGENHFNAREKDGSLKSNLPRNQEVSLAMSLKMMKRAHVEIRE